MKLSTIILAGLTILTQSYFDAQAFKDDLQFRIMKKDILDLRDVSRNFDGYGNNKCNPRWNAENTQFVRLAQPNYFDGLDIPVSNRPNPRQISNIVTDLDGPIQLNSNKISALFTFWGQMTDHDITLSLQTPKDFMNITIPNGDNQFTTSTQIPFERTVSTPSDAPIYRHRQQINTLPGWLDATQVYGPNSTRASFLRTFKDGMLKTSGGSQNLLPRQANGRFIAGQLRPNQNLALTCLQTLFMRQHNRLAAKIKQLDDTLCDQEIYTITRNFVIAEIQKITIYDWLPSLIGKQKWNKLFGRYNGYQSSVNPSISNEFANGVFRLGHSLLRDQHPQIDSHGNIVQTLLLRNMFERNDIMNNQRMNLMFKGLTSVNAKQKNRFIVDDVRNFLFLEDKVNIKLDLVSLNIQRGRDHGIPDYNTVRKAVGLSKIYTFEQITSDDDTVNRLKQAYANDLSKLDVWIGIICEKPLPGAVLGQLGAEIVGNTFQKLRDGDRFWFEQTMSPKLLRFIGGITLSDLIKYNTDISQIQDDAFHHY